MCPSQYFWKSHPFTVIPYHINNLAHLALSFFKCSTTDDFRSFHNMHKYMQHSFHFCRDVVFGRTNTEENYKTVWPTRLCKNEKLNNLGTFFHKVCKFKNMDVFEWPCIYYFNTINKLLLLLLLLQLDTFLKIS